MPSRFEKFSERARRILSLAQEEAASLNHGYIGTEHILLGLLRDPECSASRLLSNMDVDLSKVRSVVDFAVRRGDRSPAEGIGLTQPAKKVIELAVDEARQLNSQYIGTLHLLVGILREGEGVAAGVLESLGVTLEKVRAQAPELSEMPRSNYRGRMPRAKWPEDLRAMAADLKRVQMLKDEAILQQNYETAARRRDEEFELDRRFEQRYAEWARSLADEPEST